MNKSWWGFVLVFVFVFVFVSALVIWAYVMAFILPPATGATAPTTQEQRISALETKVKNLESDWDRFIRQNNKLKK